MEFLLITAIIVILFTLATYNYMLAIKASKALKKRGSDEEDLDVTNKPLEMSIRAVKAYSLGDYIVITTVIQRGSSKRSLDVVEIDEPSLLVPLAKLTSQSTNDNGGEVPS